MHALWDSEICFKAETQKIDRPQKMQFWNSIATLLNVILTSCKQGKDGESAGSHRKAVNLANVLPAFKYSLR
jgi:hypothetical protein